MYDSGWAQSVATDIKTIDRPAFRMLGEDPQRLISALRSFEYPLYLYRWNRWTYRNGYDAANDIARLAAVRYLHERFVECEPLQLKYPMMWQRLLIFLVVAPVRLAVSFPSVVLGKDMALTLAAVP